MCIRPTGRTQCIFPRSQHTCLYIYIHSLNFFVNVLLFFKLPPVAILDVQKSLLTISDKSHNFYFCDFVLQNGCRRPFWMSKTHFRWHFWLFQINTKLFFQNIFTKWPPAPILDVRNSLLNAYLAISDRYAIFFLIFDKMTAVDHISGHFRSIRNLFFFYKMAAGANFGCPKFTFDRISGHFRSILNFNFF